MLKYAELDSPDGKLLFVNPENVCTVEESGDKGYSEIAFNKEYRRTVKGTAEQVAAKLALAR